MFAWVAVDGCRFRSRATTLHGALSMFITLPRSPAQALLQSRILYVKVATHRTRSDRKCRLLSLDADRQKTHKVHSAASAIASVPMFLFRLCSPSLEGQTSAHVSWPPWPSRSAPPCCAWASLSKTSPTRQVRRAEGWMFSTRAYG